MLRIPISPDDLSTIQRDRYGLEPGAAFQIDSGTVFYYDTATANWKEITDAAGSGSTYTFTGDVNVTNLTNTTKSWSNAIYTDDAKGTYNLSNISLTGRVDNTPYDGITTPPPNHEELDGFSYAGRFCRRGMAGAIRQSIGEGTRDAGGTWYFMAGEAEWCS